MKFKTDENLRVDVAERLRAAGYDAMTVVEQKLSGVPDDEVARVCRDEVIRIATLHGLETFALFSDEPVPSEVELG